MDRRLAFVAGAQDAPPARPGWLVVVLETAWTPTSADRPDLISARQIFGRVVERDDVFDRALADLDAWAASSGIADGLIVEGTTYWYRLRETMWRWLHERMLWRLALTELERQGAVDDVLVDVDEPALIDVVRARWPSSTPHPRAQESAPEAVRAAPGPLGFSRLTRLLRRGTAPSTSQRRPGAPTTEERYRRERVLAGRAEALAGAARSRVIVLTNPGTHQRIGAADGSRQDPLFGAVIPGLEARGLQPVLLATGIDHRSDEDWALIADDDRTLPQFLLLTRWARPEDADRSAAAVASVGAAIDGARSTPVDLDGLDVSGAFIEALGAAAARIVRTDVHMLARIERFLAEIDPSAILLAQEGIRTPWLMAGRAAGVPVVAVQHGVLYTGHPGYPNRRHRAICLPTTTCVYGPFERDVLLDLAYEPDEVVVTGSPRLDLDAAPDDPDVLAEERAAVRRELGVAEGDRLLLVSTMNLRFVQRSHFAHMLEAMFCAPLERVHLVFKQHPGERDDGPYRDLLVGLAHAAGYAPPPISVVKDIDLYRLLRAADAHLGLLSTVLTEAVVTGTPNLIAMTDRHTDLLGYVEAGVALPVRTPSDMLAALDDPVLPDAAARKTFLDRHFLAGDASGRIIDVLSTSIGARAPGVLA